ncbi:MAG: DEAD/DEAH box helicase [Hellea sp.]
MTILINIIGNAFVLSGDMGTLIQNRKAKISLKRLAYRINNEDVVIPFEEQAKVPTLQDIERLLRKFSFEFEHGQDVQSDLSAYHQEQENFHIFSENARDIRNDKVSENPVLVDEFRRFKSVLEEKMKRRLYPLQMLSAFHMTFSQNACNFAVPGAGKTSIVYAAYTYLKNLPEDDSRHVNKLLVVGPLSSFYAWENEYLECFGCNIGSQRMSGDVSIKREQKEQHLYSAEPKELTLIFHGGLSLLEKEIIDFLKQHKVMVVVDEAHRIKNAEGVWGTSAIEIAKEATARVILTGTPVPNGYEDLYNLYRFIYPFKYQEILQAHYGQLKEMTKNTLSLDDERVKTFIDNISPYFIRIKKSDLKLQEAKENHISVKMDEHQREIYDFIEGKYIPELSQDSSNSVKATLNKAKLIRLRQAATNPALLLKSLKDSLDIEDPDLKMTEIHNESVDDFRIFQKIVDYEKLHTPSKFLDVKKLIETDILPKNGKVIVWTIFIQNAEGLKSILEQSGIKTKLLIGRIPPDEREETIKCFNNPDHDAFRVVIANPFSVSESISLHKGCHNAIYLERDYNAANFLQSKDRIHRVGLPDGAQTNYYYFISEHSIDSVINERLDLKVKRMEKIIDEEIPLFNRVNGEGDSDIITALLNDYAQRT